MRSLSILCLAAALAGCGWKADGPARLDELYGGGTDDGGDTGPVDLGDPQCSGLGGQWAVQLVQKGTVTPQGFSSGWAVTITDLFLGSVDAGATQLRLEFCDELTTMDTDLGRSEVPQKLREALAASPIEVPLPGDGSLAATDQVWLWGLRDVTDPLTYPLPTKDTYQADPHVYDQDDDGPLGVTVHVISPPGYRYMVKRAIWSFAPGTPTADSTWVTGALTFSIEQNAIGAVDASGNPSLTLTTPAPITAGTGSVYQLRCVGTTFTCDALVQGHEAVFADAP